MTDRPPPPPAPEHVPHRRVLVTLHLPLDMGVAAGVMTAVANGYPDAVVGENGRIWNRRERPGEEGQRVLILPDPPAEITVDREIRWIVDPCSPPCGWHHYQLTGAMSVQVAPSNVGGGSEG